MNRANRPSQNAQSQTSTSQTPAARPANANNAGADSGGFRWITAGLLISVAILLVALTTYVAVGKPKSTEAERIAKDRLQAVFLNGGQVYFGNIQGLTDDYMRLNNIYYLRVNQQVQPDGEASQANANDISLVKLGCELHGPQDEMLINREQIIFWENLKEDGAVAKAVKQFVEQNPNGQDCDAAAQQGANNGANTNTNNSNDTNTNN